MRELAGMAEAAEKRRAAKMIFIVLTIYLLYEHSDKSEHTGKSEKIAHYWRKAQNEVLAKFDHPTAYIEGVNGSIIVNVLPLSISRNVLSSAKEDQLGDTLYVQNMCALKRSARYSACSGARVLRVLRTMNLICCQWFGAARILFPTRSPYFRQ
jgi:hypothetical protein